MKLRRFYLIRLVAGLGLWLSLGMAGHVLAEPNLAEGFVSLPRGARIVLMPLDVELFSISAGGVMEPQAEWTAQALANMQQAFRTRHSATQAVFTAYAPGGDRSPDGEDRLDALNRLHGAVGGAIALHHFGSLKLPTKEGKLAWSLGEEASHLARTADADYALFTFIRDSYASSERIATMVVAAMFGVGLPGGYQVGYASLVDLRSGQIVWFNRLLRGHGDLREPDKARESLDALLANFPG
jgi:hypothetical protein